MEGWAIALIIIAFFILVLASINFLDKKIQQKKKAVALRLIAHSKRADRDRLISEIHYPINSLSENEIQSVLNSTVTELRVQLLQGSITCEQLLTIFMKRATTIGVKLECLAEFDWNNSLELARKADEIYRFDTERAKTMSLLGIPISVKDTFDMKGFDSTIGCAARCFKPAQSDGLVIKALKAEGAIFFIRSNMPQVTSLYTVDALYMVISLF
jgi:fatty acid amide hydrolase